jgi:predicted transcriptional regulator
MAKFGEEIIINESLDEMFDLLLENMTGSAIARELGITKQAVNATLQRAMKKIYLAVQEQNPDSTPFEVAAMLLQMLKPEVEPKWFFKAFPANIKKEIMDSVPEWGKKLIQ